MSTGMNENRRGPYRRRRTLSKRQLEALRFRADGHSLDQTAEFMGINRSSVSDLFQRAFDRTGTNNACGLVAMALRKGWIE